jgi:Holliday junction resolvasome RuvABC endonuclease subunit
MAQVEPTTFAEVMIYRYPKTEPLDKQHVESRMYGQTFYGTSEERVEHITKVVRKLVKAFDPDIVGIEQYAFSRHSSSVTGLAELGGVIKNWLYRRGVPFVVVESPSLKKFATGYGRTSKDKHEMIEAAWGFGFSDCPEKNHDLADAFHAARWAAWRESGAIN